MSYKFQAEPLTSGHYVLPRIGDMRTPVNAFLSEALYHATDEATWTQAVDSASLPGTIGMALMPDTHIGFGIPIGGVLVTEDVIVPMASGYDISCGVLYLKIEGLTAKRVRSMRRRLEWVEEVEKRVATGLGSKRPELARNNSRDLLHDILHFGAQPLGVSPDL